MLARSEGDAQPISGHNYVPDHFIFQQLAKTTPQ